MFQQVKIVLLLLQLFVLDNCEACGGITHIEISYRALFNYHDNHGGNSYGQIARSYQDALEAGSAFPDVFYPDVCFGGKYHDVSEDTHWTPFNNITINYIREHYPQPWDKSTKKLVAFLLGIVSHQVADISWHSLGIQQGFLKTMSYTNYNGDYTSAHSAGDLGGDVLNLYQLDLSYSDIFGDWYIPTDDLINIYKEYYNKQVIDLNTLVTCSKILYLSKVAERLAVKKYFPISANHSPFLVNNLYSYFLGGVEDMTVWTQHIWRHITWALEHGTGKCDLNRNPLFLHCNDSTTQFVAKQDKSHSLKNGFYTEPHSGLVNLMNHVKIQKQERGITLRPNQFLKHKMLELDLQIRSVKDHMNQKPYKDIVNMKVETDDPLDRTHDPDLILTSDMPYAKLGSSFAVSDLDGDGNDDVVVGSPGYTSGSQQTGMVFVIFGCDEGLNMTTSSDIREVADLHIPGPNNNNGAHSKFGSSLAVVDFDLDGNLDIVVGAPSFGSTSLQYKGAVFVYSLVGRQKYVLRLTLYCKDVYCNFGSTLTSGDLTSDSYDDIIVGSPFSGGGGEQRGMVLVVPSDKKFAGKSGLELNMSEVGRPMFGSQNYSWFGYSLDAKTSADGVWTVIGQPNFRNCSLSNCSYSDHDIQAMGKVKVMKVKDTNVNLKHQLYGSQQFAQFGTSVSLGRPLPGGSVFLAVGASGQDVQAKLADLPVHLSQVGSVYLYNLSNPSQPISWFTGDRRYGRFGAHVKFADVNKDSIDDLIIGAPLRTKDFTEELTGAQQGRVYIYFGGDKFPVGDVTSKCDFFTLLKPCPSQTASLVLNMDEDLARIGSQIAVIKGKKKTNILVTAENSSRGARLSGSIGVYII